MRRGRWIPLAGAGPVLLVLIGGLAGVAGLFGERVGAGAPSGGAEVSPAPASPETPAASDSAGGAQSGAPTSSSGADEGDAQRGSEIFHSRCMACHALDQNRVGPRLGDVWGRTSGGVADYQYSDALKMAKTVWNDETLNSWLLNPATFLPRTKMIFRLVDPQQRRDVIRFLKESSHHR